MKEGFHFRKSTDIVGSDISVSNRGGVELDLPRFRDTVHWHEKFELEILDEGEAMHIINNTSHLLRRHDIYLLTPSDIHTLRKASQNSESFLTVTCMQFTNSVISESMLNDLMSIPQPAYVSLNDEDYESIHRIVELMEIELSRNSDSSLRKVKHLMSYILVRFVDLFYEQNRHAVRPPVTNDKDLTYINKAISYIHYNFKSSELSTKRIAEVLFLSPNYFGELFFKRMGISCLDYIKKIRLNYATSLLAQSELPITDVAERSGYSSLSYFISDFRKVLGTTPRKYRLQNQSDTP